MVRDTVAPPARRGPAGLPRRRALLRRLPRQPRRTRSRCCAPPSRPAPRWSRCATPTAACCPAGSPTSSHDVLDDDRRPGRHPLPQRHRLRGRQHAGRRRRRRHPRAGHASTATASAPATPTSSPVVANLELKLRPAGAAGRACCARRPGSRTRSPRSPTSRPRRASRTSARRPSRTRPGCTPARSRSTRTSTSTWTRSASATTCGCWSPTWPAAPRSSSRARARLRPVRRPRAGRPGHRPGQGAGARGYTFEAADASFELLLREEVEGAPPVVLRGRVVAGDHRDAHGDGDEARLRGDGEAARRAASGIVATGEGNGPVNALDHALRKAIGAGLPGGREVRADRLQGPHPRPGPRHRRDHPGADRDHRRRASWVTVGVGAQRHRGVLGGAGRRGHLRPAPPRRRRQLTITPVHAASSRRRERWSAGPAQPGLAGAERCRTSTTAATTGTASTR